MENITKTREQNLEFSVVLPRCASIGFREKMLVIPID